MLGVRKKRFDCQESQDKIVFCPIFIFKLSKTNTNYRIIGQYGQIKISTVYIILLELRLARWLVV